MCLQAGDNLIDTSPTVVPAVASVSFRIKSTTVQPGATYRLRVKINPPRLTPEVRARFPIFSGWVKVDSSVDSLTVPYFGLAASLFDMPGSSFSSLLFRCSPR